MAWTVLQSDLFMDRLPMLVVGLPALTGRPVVLVGEGRRRHSLVATSDVAAYAVTALADRASTGKTLAVGGPEPLSWRDVVAAFAHELGREVRVGTVRPGKPVPGVPEAVQPLLAALETYDSLLDTAPLAQAYGIRQTALAEGRPRARRRCPRSLSRTATARAHAFGRSIHDLCPLRVG